jgi:pteridine reductase
MDLSGVTSLVTGAGRRVGRAIALGLAASGSNLIVHYNSSADGADETASKARALGVEVRLVGADLAVDPMAVVDAAGDLAPIRVLVNSAANFPADTLLDIDGAGWDRTMSVNLRGPVFLTQRFAQLLPDDVDGAVVNVTDWRTARPYADRFSYTIAKGALDTFTLAAAHSLAPRIRVNAVALGAILPPPGEDAAYLEELARTIPVGRAGGTAPVVEAVLFLLRNDFVTGEIVRIDGGAHLT